MALDIPKDEVRPMGDTGFKFLIKGSPFNTLAYLWKNKEGSGYKLQLPTETYKDKQGVEKRASMVFLPEGNPELYAELAVAVITILTQQGFIEGEI